MKLNILDRIIIVNNFLPKQSDIMSIRLAKDITAKIALDAKELDKISFNEATKEFDQGVAKGFVKECDLSSSELALIDKEIDDINDKKLINIALLDTIDKIKNLKNKS